MPQHSKPGCRPTGQRALSAAERQARYRARHTGAVVIRYRRPTDRRSRAQCWHDAVAELIALQGEYAQWFAALPEATRDGAVMPSRPSLISTSMRSPQSSRRAASDVISGYWRRNYKPCFRFQNALDQTSEQRQSFRRRDTRFSHPDCGDRRCRAQCLAEIRPISV